MTVPAQAVSTENSADQGSTGRTGATNAQETPAGATPPSSAGTEEQVTRGPDFIRNAFSQMRGYTQSAAPAPQAPPASGPTAPESEPSARVASPNGASGPSPEPSSAGNAPATTLPPRPQAQTQAKLTSPPTDDEIARRVQSETDRRIAKMQADAQARAEREREVELRRTQPFAYAQLMEDREQKAEADKAEIDRLNKVAEEQFAHFDRKVLDPIILALPESLRKDVLGKVNPAGFDGRGELAKTALTALRQHYITEGRNAAKAELLKDPAFVKEMKARFGGATTEPEPSTLLPPSFSSQPANSGAAVNAWMRGARAGVRA